MTALHDPQPGALGFLPGRGALTRILFSERDPALRPTDAEQNLAAFAAVEIGLDPPGIVPDGFTGPARHFHGLAAYVAQDPQGATYAPQSVTVQCIARWDIAAQIASGNPGTLVSRGLRRSPAQRRCYHLELRPGASPDTAEIALGWETPFGVFQLFGAAVFHVEPGWHLYTAAREYLGRDRVIVRYWKNARLLEESEFTTGAPGHIGGGIATGPVFAIGCAANGPGTWQDFFHGDIDSLVVYPHALTTDQVEQTWRRLAHHQPQIYRAHRALWAPGTKPSRHPASVAQRILKATAQAAALATAQADDLDNTGLPPRAHGRRLATWEKTLALPPSPTISIRQRQLRAQSAMQRKHSFRHADIRAALAPLLGLDPADLEVITQTNLIDEDFQTENPQRWRVERLSPTHDPGKLTLRAPAGANLRLDNGYRTPGLARTALAHDQAAVFQIHITDLVAPDDAEFGIYWRAGHTWVTLALRWTGGNHDIGYRIYQNHTLSPFTVIATEPPALWLRIRHQPGTALLPYGGKRLALGWSLTGAFHDFAETPLDTTGTFRECGIFIRSDTILSEPCALHLDHATLWTPHAPRPFALFVYRDPTLGGIYDLTGAALQLRRQAAARDTVGVTSAKTLTWGDPENGFANCPLGGFHA